MPNRTDCSTHGQTRLHAPVKNREKAYVTKPQRRKAIREITQALELIMAAEKRYVENAPLCLQVTQKYEEVGQNVAILEEVLAILADLF